MAISKSGLDKTVCQQCDHYQSEIENLREGIARAAASILLTDANKKLTDDDFKKAFEWLCENGQHSDFVADSIRERTEMKRQLEANARLIATTPELLEALKECESLLQQVRISVSLNMLGRFDHTRETIARVLAKAKGN